MVTQVPLCLLFFHVVTSRGQYGMLYNIIGLFHNIIGNYSNYTGATQIVY